jgi:hypothetical protein
MPNVSPNTPLTENKTSDDNLTGSHAEKENTSESVNASEDTESAKTSRPTKKKFAFEEDD